MQTRTGIGSEAPFFIDTYTWIAYTDKIHGCPTCFRHALACESALQRLSLYDPYLCLCLLQLDPPREGQSRGSSNAPMYVCLRDLDIVDR